MALTNDLRDDRPRRAAVLRVSGELLAERLGLPTPIRVVDGAAGAQGRMEGFVDLALAGDTPLLPAVAQGEVPPMVRVVYGERDGAVHVESWELDDDTEHAGHVVWLKPREDVDPLYSLHGDLCTLARRAAASPHQLQVEGVALAERLNALAERLADYIREADPSGSVSYDPEPEGSHHG